MVKKNFLFASALIFFVASFWSLRSLSPPLTTPATLTIRAPASESFWTQSCEFVFAPRSRFFNIQLFQRFLSDLGQRPAIEPRDMHEALKYPEAFLAMIEHLSRNNEYEGVTFSKLLKDLKPKKLKSLRKKILSATKNGFLSEAEMKSLFVEVYRITHQPQGFWKTLWTQKNLKETFEKIDDQKIIERIERSLFLHGMTKTYSDILLDKSQVSIFQDILAKRKDFFWPAITASTYLLGIALRPDLTSDPDLANSFAAQLVDTLIWVPGFFPPLSVYFNRTLSLAQTMPIQGKSLADAKADLYIQMQKDRKVARAAQIVATVYMVIYANAFSMSLVKADFDKAAAEDLRIRIEYQQKMRESEQAAERILQRLNRPMEQRIEEEFQEYFKQLVEAGLQVSKDSPEYQAIKDEYVQRLRKQRSEKK